MNAALLLLALIVPAQEEDPATVAYRQDYGRYTEISQMTDPAAQAEAYLGFLEKGFDERLMGAVLAGLQGDLAGLVPANPDKVYELGARWKAVRPEDQDPTVLSLQAAIGAKNNRRITEFGEQFYTLQPDPNVALVLAQAYTELGNQAKVRQHGMVAIDKLPITQTWQIAYGLVQEDAQAARFPRAAALARRIHDGFSQAPEGISATQWRNIRIFLRDVMARDHYEARRYKEAVAGYRSVLELDPRSDKAWYFVGDGLVRMEENIFESMNALAKSYLLSGSYSPRAREMLEAVYKANRGGSLEGLDDVLQRNRRELGL